MSAFEQSFDYDFGSSNLFAPVKMEDGFMPFMDPIMQMQMQQMMQSDLSQMLTLPEPHTEDFNMTFQDNPVVIGTLSMDRSTSGSHVPSDTECESASVRSIDHEVSSPSSPPSASVDMTETFNAINAASTSSETSSRCQSDEEEAEVAPKRKRTRVTRTRTKSRKVQEQEEVVSDVDSESMEGLTKRERNKMSAAKYRKRRKMYLDTLESKANAMEKLAHQKDSQISSLKEQNSTLHTRVSFLEEQVAFLKNLLSRGGSQQGSSRGAPAGAVAFAMFAIFLITPMLLSMSTSGEISMADSSSPFASPVASESMSHVRKLLWCGADAHCDVSAAEVLTQPSTPDAPLSNVTSHVPADFAPTHPASVAIIVGS